MTHSSILTSEGQITIPLDILVHFGLKEGGRLDFIVEGNRLLIQPAAPIENRFQRYLGVPAQPQGEPSVHN